MALTVRLLHPEATIQLVETNEDRLAVARHQWLQDGDQVMTNIDGITINNPTAVMCAWAPDDRHRARVLARLAEESVTMMVVRGPVDTPNGFALTSFGMEPWSVLVRRAP